MIDRFDGILKEMSVLHNKKAKDYGVMEDPYGNVRATEQFGVQPWIGVAIRMNDKMTRIKSMVRNGNLENESLEDSFLDLAVYSVIGLLLYRDEKFRKATLEENGECVSAGVPQLRGMTLEEVQILKSGLERIRKG